MTNRPYYGPDPYRPIIPPLPPPPTFTEVVRAVAGIISAGALFTVVFGDDEQRANAVEILKISGPIFQATFPT